MAEAAVKDARPQTKAKESLFVPADRPEGEILSSEARRVLVTSSAPKPAYVPLISSAASADDPYPGPPVAPVADPKGPRVIHENERAPAGSGLKRYKIRLLNIGGEHPWRYVLAACQEQAEKTYHQAIGLPALERMYGDALPAPRYAVRELPD